jgi:hypothetical protein
LAATSRALEEAKGTVANKLTREKEILARVETNCAQFRGFLPRFQSTIGLFFDLVKWSTSGIGVFLTISGVRKLTTIA